jgi:hypothetical protein
MHTESRKAARSSFAQHRADMLFSAKRKGESNGIERRSPTDPGMRRAIVRNGLIGYIPVAAI